MRGLHDNYNVKHVARCWSINVRAALAFFQYASRKFEKIILELRRKSVLILFVACLRAFHVCSPDSWRVLVYFYFSFPLIYPVRLLLLKQSHPILITLSAAQVFHFCFVNMIFLGSILTFGYGRRVMFTARAIQSSSFLIPPCSCLPLRLPTAQALEVFSCFLIYFPCYVSFVCGATPWSY